MDMAERPPGKGGPEEGTPEYDWLYGSRGGARPDDATRMVPQQEPSGNRPDETRVMPAQPSTSSSSGRPPGGGSRTATAAPPPKPARSRRLPRFRFGIVKLLVLLWLVFMVAVPFWAWSKIDKVDAEPDGDRPADQPGTNYLIVGSTRPTTSPRRSRRRSGPDLAVAPTPTRSSLLHTGSGADTLMSIPRDTLVEVPGHGTQMINAAFALGEAPLLVASVEQLTGIHIDHYVELGFGSVDQHRRRTRRHRDLPQDGHGRSQGEAVDREGLPGGRRRDGAGLLALALRQRARRPRPRAAASAR